MSDTIRKTFEFGSGTSQPRSHKRTFSVPAGSTVGVTIEQMSVDPPNATIPVIIEIRQASAASVGSSGPDGPLIDVKAANAPSNLVTFLPTYRSAFGCPSTWRVRVRSAVGPDVPAKVSGTIVFVFTPPSSVVLDMTGVDTQHLDPDDVVNRTLRARLGSFNSIDGTGDFRIRAKWHTDPLDVFHFGTFHKLTVELLRPDGTIANSETGFSQHAPADKTPKVDFRYTVTAQDAAMAGDWGLQITNNITNNSPIRVVDFDINKGLDPNPLLSDFESTFKASCS
jgi:hypothetical protein